MKKFVAIGTSHTQEKCRSNTDTDHYVDWENEQRWSEYLSTKLGYENYYNRSLGSYGIQSYPARVISIVKDIKPDFILLEIPSRDRYEFAVEDERYKSGDILKDNHWVEYKEKGYVEDRTFSHDDYIYKINDGDTDIDPTKLDKFQKFKNQLPASILQQSTRINVYRNKGYYEDQLFSVCVLISAYLDSKNIDHEWFNFSSSIDKSIISKYNIKCINKKIGYKSIRDYIKKSQDDKEYYADGKHLNSIHWKKIVDDIFIPYFKDRK